MTYSTIPEMSITEIARVRQVGELSYEVSVVQSEALVSYEFLVTPANGSFIIDHDPMVIDQSSAIASGKICKAVAAIRNAGIVDVTIRPGNRYDVVTSNGVIRDLGIDDRPQPASPSEREVMLALESLAAAREALSLTRPVFRRS